MRVFLFVVLILAGCIPVATVEGCKALCNGKVASLTDEACTCEVSAVKIQNSWGEKCRQVEICR